MAQKECQNDDRGADAETGEMVLVSPEKVGQFPDEKCSAQSSTHIAHHAGVGNRTKRPVDFGGSKSLKFSRNLAAKSSASASTGSSQSSNPGKSVTGPSFLDFPRIQDPSSSSVSESHVDFPSLQQPPPDFLLLCWSLVADQAVPAGYEKDFATLETAVQRASDSSVRKASRVDNISASIWLHSYHEAAAKAAKILKRSEDQFLLAALEKPARFRCRWQQQCFEGPSARKDAEEHLRRKWLEILENLLRGTDTPMGNLISDSTPGAQPLGAGRRASTLRSRVRAARTYLAWLALAHGLCFPTSVSHLLEYLQTRHSEPCNRGSLKVAHNSFIFLEETAAVEVKLTQQSLYGTMYKELLATAGPGRRSRYAPRFPVVLVEALERNVVREEALFYHRVYSWWILLQCWGTLRFSDHRGLSPDEHFLVEGNVLTARLTRSKTIGTACVSRFEWWLSLLNALSRKAVGSQLAGIF